MQPAGVDLLEIPITDLGEDALRYITDPSIELQRIRAQFRQMPGLKVAYEPLVRGSILTTFLKSAGVLKRWGVSRREVVIGVRSNGCVKLFRRHAQDGSAA